MKITFLCGLFFSSLFALEISVLDLQSSDKMVQGVFQEYSLSTSNQELIDSLVAAKSHKTLSPLFYLEQLSSFSEGDKPSVLKLILVAKGEVTSEDDTWTVEKKSFPIKIKLRENILMPKVEKLAPQALLKEVSFAKWEWLFKKYQSWIATCLIILVVIGLIFLTKFLAFSRKKKIRQNRLWELKMLLEANDRSDIEKVYSLAQEYKNHVLSAEWDHFKAHLLPILYAPSWSSEDMQQLTADLRELKKTWKN